MRDFFSVEASRGVNVLHVLIEQHAVLPTKSSSEGVRIGSGLDLAEWQQIEIVLRLPHSANMCECTG